MSGTGAPGGGSWIRQLQIRPDPERRPQHTQAPRPWSNVHGITIYHISKGSQKDSNHTYYRSTIDLALTTSWDEFLNAYAQ